MKNTHTLRIDAPPARVFELINDSESLKQWIPNLIENEQLTTTKDRVGSTFRQVYLENGKRMEMTGEVVAFEQDRHLACKIEGKAFDLIVDYSLRDVSGQTELTQHSEVVFKSVPMKILSTLMKPLIRKASRDQLSKQFAKLKELAEQQ
jgi:uncharacterized protein YndB with AHSA1/START domain